MKIMLRAAVMVVMGLVVTSCSGSKEKCRQVSDCQGGYGCVDGACRRLCFAQQDCDANEICWEGTCHAPTSGLAPEITSVNGNAQESPRRIVDGLVVEGSRLGSAIFELRDAANAAVSLTVRSQSDMAAEVVLPTAVRQGPHLLIATNQAGSTEANVALELPDLSGDVLVDRINTQATTKLALGVMPEALVALQVQNEALVARLAALEDTSCPRGYTHDTTRADIVLCKRGHDEMVQVGELWVDRYEGLVVSPGYYNNGQCDGACVEGSTCFGSIGAAGNFDTYPATFPDNGQVTNKADLLYACSVSGVVPSRKLTWFQAAVACMASGKHLITNAEWQVAAAGTVDPGSWPDTDAPCTGDASTYHPRQCNTCSSGAAPSGDASCVSLHGAEDMIGNLWEWTAQWMQVGQHEPLATWTDALASSTHWPDSSYGGDGSWNVFSRANNGVTRINGIVAAPLRGGWAADGARTGVFALAVSDGVSYSGSHIGFRCARR